MSKTNNTAARGNSRQSTERPSGRLVESFTITLDAETVNRLRFIAKEDGVTVEQFIAESTAAAIVGGLEALEIRDQEEAMVARVAKLNTPRAA